MYEEKKRAETMSTDVDETGLHFSAHEMAVTNQYMQDLVL